MSTVPVQRRRARAAPNRRTGRPSSTSCELRREQALAPRRSRRRSSATTARAASRSASASTAWSTPASFQEVGRLTGSGRYEDGKLAGVTPAPYVMGLSMIGGRPVAVGGEDFTIRGGTSWSGDRKKGGQGGFVEDLAHEYRIPLVNLIDGAGGSVTSIKRRGHSVFPGVHGFEQSVRLMGEVPVVCAVHGHGRRRAGRARDPRALVGDGEGHEPGVRRRPARGGALARPEDQQGGSRRRGAGGRPRGHHRPGRGKTEQECFELIRRYLSYMPQNVWELPPLVRTGDPVDRCEDGLKDIVPRNRRRPYDMRRIVRWIADRDSVFETAAHLRQGGHHQPRAHERPRRRHHRQQPDGLRRRHRRARPRASRPTSWSCATASTSRIVFLVDVPGFMVGRDAEAAATLREGMRSVYVSLQATVPMYTVVIRKCYGMAGMGATDKNGLDLKIAWPSAEWGSLPIEGGVAAAFRKEIAAAADPRAREAEIEASLRADASPFKTAEAFGVEEIIDPRETRPYLCRFIDAAQSRLATMVGQKPKYGVRP